MKTLGFAAVLLLGLGFAGAADAENFTTVQDPSGADMCFDASGDKAPLSSCQAGTYVSKMDPSGALMCFDASGDKAPLSSCQVESFVSMTDPSGAAMCFSSSGHLAPLDKCSDTATASVQTTRAPGTFVAMRSFFR